MPETQTGDRQPGDGGRKPRAKHRKRFRLYLMAVPVIIGALITGYINSDESQSAQAAVIDPGDCGSLDSLTGSFDNELVTVHQNINSYLETISNEGPTQNGTDAAYALFDYETVELPVWHQEEAVYAAALTRLDCDTSTTGAYPFLAEQMTNSTNELNEVEGLLTSAEENETVEDTISSEEDGYDPCEDAATIQSAPLAADRDAGSGGAVQNVVPLAGNVVQIDLSEAKYPESAKHIKDAIAAGKPKTLTVNRTLCKKNRRASLRGVQVIKGKDRDEYPFAMTAEGGAGASVRHIDPKDNRGSGSTIGGALRQHPDGTQFEINIVP